MFTKLNQTSKTFTFTSLNGPYNAGTINTFLQKKLDSCFELVLSLKDGILFHLSTLKNYFSSGYFGVD